MFAILISEKGGAERRESFEKNEINVGRVQGNDLVLPKGNVSKHHARLLFRDARFIVTDLKSTNGTYVNGRKIAQATIVREGDKIYIGDFVICLETAAAIAASAQVGEAAPIVAGAIPAQPRPSGRPHVATLQASTSPPGVPLPQSKASNVSEAPPAMPPRAPEGSETNYSLHDEPDDSAPAHLEKLPPVAKLTTRLLASEEADLQRPATTPLPLPKVLERAVAVPLALGPSHTLPPAQTSPLSRATAFPLRTAVPVALELPSGSPRPSNLSPAPVHSVLASPSSPRASVSPARIVAKDSALQAGHRLALTMLLGRISDAIDLSPLRESSLVSEGLISAIERAAREQVAAMREEGEAPEAIDLDAVMKEATRELVGLGALAAHLDDDDVLEVHFTRYDQASTLRVGRNVCTHEPGAFSSEDAFRRAIERLAYQSGDAWRAGEAFLERDLPRLSFVAMAPPTSAHLALSVRKRRRVEATLEQLVNEAAVSPLMAQFLEACVASHANILVSGVSAAVVLSALGSAGPVPERVVVVQALEEIALVDAQIVSLRFTDSEASGERMVRGAARLRPDRLIVDHLTGGVAAATLDAMLEGCEGVLASVSAPTLRQALARLVGQLVVYRPGLSVESMRDVVGDLFDIAVEVLQLPDGRVRITRIAELGGSDAKGILARDVFVFTPDSNPGQGTTDGSFSATGVVPRVASEFSARGLKVDAGMFKRSGRQ